MRVSADQRQRNGSTEPTSWWRAEVGNEDRTSYALSLLCPFCLFRVVCVSVRSFVLSLRWSLSFPLVASEGGSDSDNRTEADTQKRGKNNKYGHKNKGIIKKIFLYLLYDGCLFLEAFCCVGLFDCCVRPVMRRPRRGRRDCCEGASERPITAARVREIRRRNPFKPIIDE